MSKPTHFEKALTVDDWEVYSFREKLSTLKKDRDEQSIQELISLTAMISASQLIHLIREERFSSHDFFCYPHFLLSYALNKPPSCRLRYSLWL